MITIEERRSLLVRWGLIICYSLFIIVPLVVLLVTNLTQEEISISEEEALRSDIDATLMQTIEDEYESDVDDYVMHQISKVGDYTIILVTSITADEYGDSSLLIVKEEGNEYDILYNGQVYTEDVLKEADIPDRVISEVRNKNKYITEYLATIANASANPLNKYPLISVLPYASDNLNISYLYEEGSDIPVIEISAIDATDRKNALTVIHNLCECESAEYNIRYINFVNPFTGGDR
ncbi:hypothetical protein IJG01_03015 [Candidatus Saccharibacteria bacterium]|nr:hypothetical protein [Candidatus Saccharibacteria bacterium]